MSQANNIQWIVYNGDSSLINSTLSEGAKYTYKIQSKYPVSSGDMGFVFQTAETGIQREFAEALKISPSIKKEEPSHFLHVSNAGKVRLRDICNTYGKEYEGKPAIGLYNSQNGQVTVVESGAFNYGFINAMVLGFLSKQHLDSMNMQYAHAACFSVNGTGVLMIGDHKAGKSTLTSRILSEAANMDTVDLALISDDWVLLDEDLKSLTARRLSGEYRLDKDTAISPIAGLSPVFNDLVERYRLGLADKASIPVSELCRSTGHKDLVASKLHKIIVLDPFLDSTQEQLTWNRATKEILTASTANVMPLSQSEEVAFDLFWANQISMMDCITINNRHKDHSVGETAKNVLGFACQ